MSRFTWPEDHKTGLETPVYQVTLPVDHKKVPVNHEKGILGHAAGSVVHVSGPVDHAKGTLYELMTKNFFLHEMWHTLLTRPVDYIAVPVVRAKWLED